MASHEHFEKPSGLFPTGSERWHQPTRSYEEHDVRRAHRSRTRKANQVYQRLARQRQNHDIRRYRLSTAHSRVARGRPFDCHQRRPVSRTSTGDRRGGQGGSAAGHPGETVCKVEKGSLGRLVVRFAIGCQKRHDQLGKGSDPEVIREGLSRWKPCLVAEIAFTTVAKPSMSGAGTASVCNTGR